MEESEVNESAFVEDAPEVDEVEPQEQETQAPEKNYVNDQDMDRIVKLKIDGEEMEVSLRDAIKIKQKEQASDKRMQEAAKERHMANQLKEFAKANPRKFMEIVGVDPYEFAEMTLAEKLETMSMTPEQRELAQLRQEKQMSEEEKREREQREQREAMSREEQVEMQKLGTEIETAWKESGLPQTNEFRVAVAQVMRGSYLRNRQMKAQGMEPEQDLTAAEAAAIVKGNWQKSLSGTLSQMDAEAILNLLGDELIGKISQAKIKRVTQRASPEYKTSSPGKKSASGKSRKPLDEKQYAEWLKSLEA